MLWGVNTQPDGCSVGIRTEGCIFAKHRDVRQKNNDKICIIKAISALYAHCQSTEQFALLISE